MSITSLLLEVTEPVEGKIDIVNNMPEPQKQLSSNTYRIPFPGEIFLSMTRYDTNMTIQYSAFYDEQKTDDIEKMLQNINAKPITSAKNIIELINIEKNQQSFQYYDLKFVLTQISYDLEESILGAVYDEANRMVPVRGYNNNG